MMTQVDLAMKVQGFNPKGLFWADQFRKGPFIGRHYAKNDIVNEGKNLIFNVMFNNTTPIANNSWFAGLITSVGFSALVSTDVMNSHAGWAEFVGYSGGTRLAWGSGASSGQTVTNATPLTYTLTAAGTIQGIFICTSGTIGGTTGNLWSTALFGTPVPVNIADLLKVTYTLNS